MLPEWSSELSHRLRYGPETPSGCLFDGAGSGDESTLPLFAAATAREDEVVREVQEPSLELRP
jgi:hypothetical protein